MQERGYRAFISYSHADQRWGRWLHRKLEGYRVPHKLVGRKTPEGRVPRRLTPIFRDLDDLPAGSNLTEEVLDALRTSRFLIVICSPAAAASRWVNQEILYFKRLHGEGRILAAIVDGEPGASERPGEEDQECFPQALRFRIDDAGELTDTPVEQVAADFRPGHDGRRYGRSKLAAGLLGVKLDDLVRRESQRRNARMTMVTSGSLAIALAMGLLAYATVLARNEAQQQRAEAVRARDDAEGLIEFMLTDLRQKLDAVGRLDALDVVGRRALTYYGAQDVAGLAADALGRRARTQLLIGEVDNLRGDLDAALEAYLQAAATTDELLSREPQDTQRLFDHAQSVFWVGYIAWQRGDLQQARERMEEYLDHAERLVELEPGRPEWRTELGYAVSSLGSIDFERRDWASALESFTRSRGINLATVANHPDDEQARLDLGQDYSYIGETLSVLGRYTEAIESFESEIRLYDELIAMSGAHELAAARRQWALIFLARIELDLGRPGVAARKLTTLERAVQKRIAQDSEDTRLREALAVVLIEAAAAHAAGGDHAAAQRAARGALDTSRELAAMDRENLLWQSYFGHALVATIRNGDGVVGGEELEAQRERLAQLAERSPDSTFAALAAAETERLAGDLAAQEGRLDAATAHWRHALASLPADAERRTPDEQCAALGIHAALGQVSAARRIAATLRASGYRHPNCAAFADFGAAESTSGNAVGDDDPGVSANDR
jgi:tetratricopeptide (TPR) repeat protein